MHTHAHGVGTRLQHGDQPPLANAAPQPFDGGGDCSGVMREIIIDVDAAGLAGQFHAPAHAAECGQRLD